MRGRRLYVAPSEEVPVERWDYTEDAPIGPTLALGRDDALRHRQSLERLLSVEPADARAAAWA
jgi:hypothetical protein